tara:strand:- start:321 stop:464 length:144 start_codon:yes stop_codon:yes gene_type:complete
MIHFSKKKSGVTATSVKKSFSFGPSFSKKTFFLNKNSRFLLCRGFQK